MTLWRSIIFHYGGPNHIETSPLVCRANQWTCFYMIGTFVMKELKKSYLFEVYSSSLSAFDTSQILLMASYLLNNFKTSLCVINRNLHTLLTYHMIYKNLLNNWNYPPDMSNIQRRPTEWMIYFIHFKLMIKIWKHIHLYTSNAIFCV